MEAGRELDALIAEKVFGFTIITKSNGERYPVNPLTTKDDPPDEWGHVKQYSTDIAAAWEIVSKFKALAVKVGEKHPYCNEPWISFTQNIEDGDYDFNTAFFNVSPHAICLAALKAIE